MTPAVGVAPAAPDPPGQTDPLPFLTRLIRGGSRAIDFPVVATRKPRTPSREPELVRRDGGLCVAFVNTASAKRTPVTSYADLLVWGQRHEILGAADAERLARAAGERPADAEAVLRQAQELRAAAERILLALVAHRRPETADLGALNAVVGRALVYRRLVPDAEGYRWDWGGDGGGDDLDRVLWPVVLSVTEVLTGKYRRQVRRCAGEGCDLLFVDRTPGSPRKWCDVKKCGQSVRARTYYHATVKPMRERSRQRARSLRDLLELEAQADDGEQDSSPAVMTS